MSNYLSGLNRNNQEITKTNIPIKAGDLINFSINVYGEATGIDYSYELDSIDGSPQFTWDGQSPTATFYSNTTNHSTLTLTATYKVGNETFNFSKTYRLIVS